MNEDKKPVAKKDTKPQAKAESMRIDWLAIGAKVEKLFTANKGKQVKKLDFTTKVKRLQTILLREITPYLISEFVKKE